MLLVYYCYSGYISVGFAPFITRIPFGYRKTPLNKLSLLCDPLGVNPINLIIAIIIMIVYYLLPHMLL